MSINNQDAFAVSNPDLDPEETREWLESLDAVARVHGRGRAREIMLNSPIGVALTKEGMWSALEIPGMQAAIDLENRQQIMATFSQDATETWKAFAEKRLPQYTPE